MDIKGCNIKELEELASKIRQKILTTVSKNGGHLSSTLGAVDLIVAMHYVFDSKKDPFIFDVSHQAYAHKLLTDRWDKFESLRQFGGICGYTSPDESEYDYYKAGHSSTSISLAVGAAKAIKLKGENRLPVVLIGDGSMSAGMVYEALNELGDRKYPVVIILNDNEMSIAKPIGAISRYLSKGMASGVYTKFKAKVESVLERLPEGAYMAKRFEESFRLITPGLLFEELGIKYIGPIDGHNIESLIEAFNIAKKLNRPVVVHTQTIKGKGYEIAEGPQEHWHGVGPFEIESGKSLKKSSSKKSATAIYGDYLLELAKKDKKIVGVTAAMPGGTGLSKLLVEEFPERFWDVAIAEQHAVTSMGPLAKEGFKPFCTIYSTFLQRGYDQVVHDIALMNLGVVFAIDRAGIVGEDGETHQGAFDVSYLRAIPNMTLAAPCNEDSFKKLLDFSVEFSTPLAIRYPRGAFIADNFETPKFELAKSHLIEEGEDLLFIGYGNGVGRAIESKKLMQNANPAILDLRFVKPLDEDMLKELAKDYKKWFVFSDSAYAGGVASAILEFLEKEKIEDILVESFEYPDIFIPHGSTAEVEHFLGIMPEQIAKKIEQNL